MIIKIKEKRGVMQMKEKETLSNRLKVFIRVLMYEDKELSLLENIKQKLFSVLYCLDSFIIGFFIIRFLITGNYKMASFFFVVIVINILALKCLYDQRLVKLAKDMQEAQENAESDDEWEFPEENTVKISQENIERIEETEETEE